MRVLRYISRVFFLFRPPAHVEVNEANVVVFDDDAVAHALPRLEQNIVFVQAKCAHGVVFVHLLIEARKGEEGKL